MPGDGRAPVVTGDHRGICAERVQQTDHIAYQVQKRVLLDGLGAVGLAVAAHVWRDRAKASFPERLKLVPPGIPRLRESMTQEHERTGAAFGDVHANSVRFDEAMLEFNHRAADQRLRFRRESRTS